METLKNLFKKYKEIIMYLVFGVATTVVNWIVYIICTKLFGLSGAELSNGQIAVCNGIAWVVAVTFAFITNKLFVFESKSWKPSVAGKEFTGFIGARIFSFVIETLMMFALVTLLSFNDFAAKIIVGVVVVILNYVFSKLSKHVSIIPQRYSPRNLVILFAHNANSIVFEMDNHLSFILILCNSCNLRNHRTEI